MAHPLIPPQFPPEACYFPQVLSINPETRHFTIGELVCVNTYTVQPGFPGSGTGMYFFRVGATGALNDPWFYILLNQPSAPIGRTNGRYIDTITPAQVQAHFSHYHEQNPTISAYHIIAIPFTNPNTGILYLVYHVFPWTMVGQYVSQPSPAAVRFVIEHWAQGLPEDLAPLILGSHMVPQGFGSRHTRRRRRKIRKSKTRKN